ncbi:MAG: tetratricopeptide repeat protein [Verrucomicrobia bacterium]|nr:tetratricopeptide repeat protein [Verrucomicrobiota bacterium]
MARQLSDFLLMRGLWCEARRLYHRAVDAARAPALRAHLPGLLYALGHVARLLGDHAEARAFFDDALAAAPRPARAELVAAVQRELGTMNWIEGRCHAALKALKAALAWHTARKDPAEQAGTLHLIAVVHRGMGHLVQAGRHFKRALALAEESGDVLDQARILHDLGLMHGLQHDFARARQCFEQSLSIRRQLQDRQGIAFTSLEIGSISRKEHRFEDARRWIEDSLCLAQYLGDKFCRGRALSELGKVLVDLHQVVEARDRFHQALQVQETINDVRGQCITLFKLAELECELGNVDEAMRRHRQSLELAHQAHMPYWSGLNYIGLGKCARKQGLPQKAAIYFESVVWLARARHRKDLLKRVLPELPPPPGGGGGASHRPRPPAAP